MPLTINGNGNVSGSTVNFDAMPQHATRAVVEYGSNANGDYIRYSDGTQICWFREASSRQCSLNISTNYWTWASSAAYSFPAAFVNGNAVISQAFRDASSTYSLAGIIISNTATSVTVRGMGVNNAQYSYGGYIAIGRWY